MAALCTFADDNEFADLCEALGDRLEEQIRNTEDKSLRKDASFCFLAGSKLEKVVAIWIEELRENEQRSIETATDDTSFSIHVRALQSLIEKVTIFRQVTNFQDTERTKDADWKLSMLYDKYIEYADVVATHGRLQVAQKYLDLVPEKHPEAEIARNRIKLAMRHATPQRSQQTVPTTRTPVNKPLPQASMYPAQPAFSAPAAAPAAATTAPRNPYAPPTAATTQPVNPYTPPSAAATQPQTSNSYAPIGGGGYTPAGYQPPQPPTYGTQPLGGSVPPPPSRFQPISCHCDHIHHSDESASLERLAGGLHKTSNLPQGNTRHCRGNYQLAFPQPVSNPFSGSTTTWSPAYSARPFSPSSTKGHGSSSPSDLATY